MRQPLSSKYKPTTLDEFSDGGDLVDVLRAFIAMDSIAVLLIGDSGSGKTSLINAIIREYYGRSLPPSHDNIMTINTLKEQGIQYYRNDVKIFCQTASAIPGKKKILLLDDLDIINEQSQQVFRNCMDKHSDRVLFIASCCNAQKVIDSIQSRMDIVRLRPPSVEKLTAVAESVVSNESISVDPEVIRFVVSVCNGSIRTLVNYMEKFRLLDCHITSEIASRVCTNIAFSDLDTYTSLCRSGDLPGAIEMIDRFAGNGYSVTDILDSYFTYIKCTHTLPESCKYAVIPVLCKYITVFHDIHEDEIELKFFTNALVDVLTDKQNM